ncbi:MAG: ribonuclease R [Candidatus Cloacimonetes bacterium HGW-Cloacimonetes-1]|jgi:ribonuclease R|nr:MAG: ribonuclease R [Candidatus Cloacimonetes bacterium HGW-Cloacimonetes-1]
MKNRELYKTILQLLESHKETPLSMSEICHILSIPKHKRDQTRVVLEDLIIANKLISERSKYRLKPVETKPLKAIAERSSALLEGVFDATPLARNYSYAFVKTTGGDYFVSSEDTLNAYHGDTVLFEPFLRRGKSKYCVIRRIVSRANDNLAGDIKSSDGRYYFICSNPKIHNWFDVISPSPEYDGKKVILTVSNWGNRPTAKNPTGKVTEILGESGNPEVEVLAVIRQNQLPLQFPEEVIEFALNLSEQITDADLKGREDYRKLFTFTIDPASAKDYDDAISIVKNDNGWDLYVHIADVAHYVKPESPLFIEAVNRGNSYYFPKKVIPMLPEKISNKLCSLRPNEDKLTMTVHSVLDKNGKVIRQRLFESVIHSDFRLAYEEVDDLFDGKQTDLSQELIAALNESRMLSKQLTKIRKDAGYIFFDLPEIEYVYDDEGFIKRFNLSEETESHKLIENFMLLANEFVATKLLSLSPVSIYRIHEDPDYKKIERLGNTLNSYGLQMPIRENLNKSIQAVLLAMPTPEYHTVFDRIVLRSMMKAKYTTEHVRHFGLSIENYTHFTSPIRRLCDLVIHHLCKTYVCKTNTVKFSTEQVKHYAEVSSEKEIIANDAERDVGRVYNNTYMKDKIGETYSGLVIGVNSNGLIVRLNDIPINGVLKISGLKGGAWSFLDTELRLVNKRSGDYYQLMDKVIVQVMDVSDDIYFELTQDADSHIHTYDYQASNKQTDSTTKAPKRSFSKGHSRKPKRK